MATKPTAPTTEPKPEPTITIAAVKPPGVLEGPVDVEDYKPTDEDMARLAKNMSSSEAPPPPEPEVTRATIIPPSIAARTLAEMEAGRKVVEEKTKLREKMLGL